jgi:NADPH:quinone reductase-like Zn-dependent oxidoreductase
VLQLKEVEKPAPKDNEVLIRVYATTVTATDCLMRRGEPSWGRIFLGFRKPRKSILGIELAGEVAAVGKDVQRFSEGDHVFGAAMLTMSCTAEYVCLPERAALAAKPANMTFEEAAAFPDGALTALTFLQDLGKIQSGQKVLINGASGSVGSFAVQLARYSGAEVTGVCSTANVEWVRALGAEQVVDYTKEDFAQSGETYDLIFDTVGKISFSRCEGSLKPGGLFVASAMDQFLWPVLPQMLWTSLFGRKKVKTGASKATTERLEYLKGLVEAGEIRSVIDRCYSLEQTIEAHRYVDKGHKKGNVVITLAENSET